MLDEFLKDAQARAMPNNMGMHGEQKQPPFDVGAVKFAPLDLSYQRWGGIRSDSREAVHTKVRAIVLDPFYWEFHNTSRLTVLQEFVGFIVAH